MTLFSMFQPPTWTVTEITRYLRELLESDESLQDLWVRGEVSNLSRPASGHIYFTLKDSTAALRCVMWRSVASRQRTIPCEGEAIEAHGTIGIYEASGQYQLYADFIRPAGEGELYLEFLRLKDKLAAEGLFDVDRKKPVPSWPNRIGIVTSPTGAALRDMLHTLQRRYPVAEVILAASPVQGEEAPTGIIAALNLLNNLGKPDVILLGRGGGSIEDLHAFNDERVARAIAACQAPVITGIGHETDYTIADFVADLRAPTPTAAAELATPDKEDLQASVDESLNRLLNSINSFFGNMGWKLETIQKNLLLYSPQIKIRSGRQRLDELFKRAEIALDHRLQLHQARLLGIQKHLAALNPQGILERGYAVVIQADGNLVRSVNQAQPGDDLDVHVRDGSFGVRVRDPDGG
jgi:exodeoxyribonuclease VII large subunit